MHRHVGDELLYVIEGSIADNTALPPPETSAIARTDASTVSAARTARPCWPLSPAVSNPRPIWRRSAVAKLQPQEIAWVEGDARVRQKRSGTTRNQATRCVGALDPGAQLPRHKHVGDELIFGNRRFNADESGEVLAGNMN